MYYLIVTVNYPETTVDMPDMPNLTFDQLGYALQALISKEKDATSFSITIVKLGS